MPTPHWGYVQFSATVPAVRDRVAQEVLRQLLSPLFEQLFHDDSYGFRPGRSTHHALERVKGLQRLGHCFVLDADISGFFDNIPFRVIMQGLTNVVADGNILRLVQRFLRAGVMEDGVVRPTTVGTPQGGVLTPPTMLQTAPAIGGCYKRGRSHLVDYSD
ncbi:MAG: hypothetical protein JXQ75_06105, partial [Phycisphaerae bacterium]|nr:hypothetical protein [Phycisphaerae bacterium]